MHKQLPTGLSYHETPMDIVPGDLWNRQSGQLQQGNKVMMAKGFVRTKGFVRANEGGSANEGGFVNEGGSANRVGAGIGDADYFGRSCIM